MEFTIVWRSQTGIQMNANVDPCWICKCAAVCKHNFKVKVKSEVVFAPCKWPTNLSAGLPHSITPDSHDQLIIELC